MFDVTKSGALAEMKVFVGTMRERTVTFGPNAVRLQSVPPEIFAEGRLIDGFSVVPVERRKKTPPAATDTDTETSPESDAG